MEKVSLQPLLNGISKSERASFNSPINLIDELEQKTYLLQLSRILSQIKNTPELYRTLVEHIQPQFGFCDASLICAVEDESRALRFLVRKLVKEVEENSELLKLVPQSSFPATGVFADILKADKYLIIDVEEKWLERPGDWPMIVAMKINVKQVVCVQLRQAGHIIGTWHFHYYNGNRFDERRIGLLLEIADLLAIAVANILVNEEKEQKSALLEKEEWEKSMLFSIIQAVATIRERKKLFATIFDCIKPLIPVEDTGFAVFDKSGKYWQSWSNIDNYQNSAVNTELQTMGYDGFLPMDDWMQYASQGSGIMTFAEFRRRYPEHPFGEVIWKAGLREMLFTPLIYQEQKLGVIFLDSKQEGTYTQEHLLLLEKIACQVAIAVANVLANEEVLNRQREKSVLLKVSEAIATVRGQEDLLKTIVSEIKPLFDFYDCGILIINANNRYFDLAVTHPGIDSSEVNYKLHDEGFAQGWNYRGSVLEWTVRQLEKAGEPILFDYTANFSGYGDSHLLEKLKALGYKEGLAGLLKIRGKVLGCFFLNYTVKGQTGGISLSLFQHVVDQLSVAVANILANEEVKKRELEKTALLSVSEAISKIKSRKELRDVIYQNIQPLFPFVSTGLFVTDAEKDVSYEFLDNEAFPDELNNTLKKEGLLGPWQLSSSHHGSWWMQTMPVIRTTAEEIAICKGHPSERMIELIAIHGLKQFIGGPLFANRKKIGAICFNSGQENFYSSAQLSLFKGISEQIAIAVANILANEEISKREKENSLLLTLSNDIAGIRSKEDLMIALNHKLKPLLHYDDAVIALLTPDKQRHYAYLLDVCDSRSSHKNFQQMAAASYTVQDGIAQYVIATDVPLVYSLTEERENEPPYLQFIRNRGINTMVVVALKHGGENIGLLYLQSEKLNAFATDQLALIKGVADQLSTTIANILANEAIARKEKETAIQLCIVNHINTTQSWEQRFEAIARELQPHLSFGFLYITIEKDQPGYGHGYLRTGRDEYQYVNKSHFLRLVRLDDARFARLLRPVSEKQKRIVSESSLDQAKKNHPMVAAICDGLGMKSNVAYSQPLSGYGTFFISLFHSSTEAYTDESLQLLENIFSGITATLEKNLHADEIVRLKEKLEHEKIYLTDEIKSTFNFDEIIGSSQDMQDVYNKVNQVAKTDVTVLITGETGTGKELIARAIHNYSSRKANVMIKLNCAALPAQLIESELFGHERGAFTGAIDKRVGKFEIANNSTIFLDEIGELSLELQAKLLRVLQEKEFERLGGNKVIKTDVRVLAATNRNLEKEVAEGRFRSDLYYRVAVFPIELPALRDRKDDIPLLASHFIEKYNRKFSKHIAGLSTEVLQELLTSKWPGNIRELEHVLERAIMLTSGKMITSLFQSKKVLHNQYVFNEQNIVPRTLAAKEKEHILETLKLTNGRIRGKGGAAEILDIKPTTLESRMKKLGVERKFG